MQIRLVSVGRWMGRVVLLTVVACAHVEESPVFENRNAWMDEASPRLVAATVEVLREGASICTGAVTARADLVVTAAHCTPGEGKIGAEVEVILSTGRREGGTVEAASPSEDIAVIRLRKPAEVAPLPLANSDGVKGRERILFLGRPMEGGRPVQRHARVKSRGPCEWLPAVDDAIFAVYFGLQGDSGAPLLGKEGVIGIVQGGRGCKIAIPSSRIIPLVEQLIEQAG